MKVRKASTKPILLRISLDKFAAATFLVFSIAGATVLIWTLGTVHGADAERAMSSSQKIRENAEFQIRSKCIGKSAKLLAMCAYESIESDTQRQHDRLDLIAQERAAWGSMVAAGSGLLTFFATIAGLVYIAGTLTETRLANRRGMKEFARARIDARRASNSAQLSLEATRESASAASSQVKIADKMARKQLRAYLAVLSVEIDGIYASGVHLILKVENKGSTPAKIDQFGAYVWIGTAGELNPSSVGPPIEPFYVGNTILATAAPHPVRIWNSKCDPSLIGKDIADLFVYGRIDYSDVFEDNHWLTFSFCLPGWTAESKVMLKHTVHGNSSSM